MNAWAWALLKEWLPDILSGIVNFVLVMAGILLSFETFVGAIDKDDKLRKRFAAVFIVLGLIGGIFEIYEHHHGAKESHDLLLNVNKELKDTDLLLGKTDAVLEKITTVESETSGIFALTDRIKTIERKISVAREKHDPAVISNLQKELSAAEKAKLELSKQILFSAGRSITELLNIFRDWKSQRGSTKDAGELQKIDDAERNASVEAVGHARAATKQMLSLLPEPTPEDKLEDLVFYAMLRTGSSPEGIKRVADYMNDLVKRAIAANPQLER
jgi:hypothetical protein